MQQGQFVAVIAYETIISLLYCTLLIAAFGVAIIQKGEAM